MNKDYKIIIVWVNGKIEIFQFDSAIELKTAYDIAKTMLRHGEVIRATAFGKVVYEFDSEEK